MSNIYSVVRFINITKLRFISEFELYCLTKNARNVF